MSVDGVSTSRLDSAACAREPIHVPGAIQPHGVLLAATPDSERVVVHASANLAAVLGVEAADVLGRPLWDVLPPLAEAVEGWDAELARQDRLVRSLDLPLDGGMVRFDVARHRAGGVDILELETAAGQDLASGAAVYEHLAAFVEKLQASSELMPLCVLAAVEVRRITGFDRVLVYRFDEDWNGTVVAEDGNGNLPSYLDLRFPASDIPAQARDLYRRNRLRIIPDATYEPVPILPPLDPRTGRPLDMSFAGLRAVSPVHVEYMRNMGTMASMSVSILVGGRLWGLISCHNRQPRRVPIALRNACDFLAQVLAIQIEAREQSAQAELRMRLGSIGARLLGYMAQEDRFIDGLLNHPDDLMALTGSVGAAIISGERCWTVGTTPGEGPVRQLHEWLSGTHSGDDVFSTDALGQVFPPARSYADRASGLLAISISKKYASHILWFRPEMVETVRWGGDPNKSIPDGAEPQRLHPRKSFEAWKEIVRGRSVPWAKAEIDAVKELRNAVLGIVLRRAEELASLSEELQRSNKELEAFSYSVSHDLRAPFRHIVGFAELLKKRAGPVLDDQGRRYIDTIIESAFSAGTLVDNLLSFSQMGRVSLNRVPVDMNVLVTDAARRAQRDAEPGRRLRWTVHPLGSVEADPMMLRLVVENLLSNAVKFTRDREEALIEIGSRREDGEEVFYVKDNGVGFDMAYVDKLFGVFQRLHRMEEFEGTGIGLANVRRIVERHGGRTWAEGVLGQGATFYFALPMAEEVTWPS